MLSLAYLCYMVCACGRWSLYPPKWVQLPISNIDKTFINLCFYSRPEENIVKWNAHCWTSSTVKQYMTISIAGRHHCCYNLNGELQCEYDVVFDALCTKEHMEQKFKEAYNEAYNGSCHIEESLKIYSNSSGRKVLESDILEDGDYSCVFTTTSCDFISRGVLREETESVYVGQCDGEVCQRLIHYLQSATDASVVDRENAQASIPAGFCLSRLPFGSEWYKKSKDRFGKCNGCGVLPKGKRHARDAQEQTRQCNCWFDPYWD